ncbi:MAG: DNA replication/repair protein RecF [Armatimonadota bacterium]
MELRKLRLEHFRNYPSLDLTLGPGMHVFAGANAQGKTNLLESVYVAATGRSPRTSQESEMIAWEAEIGRVRGEFHSEIRGDFTVDVSLGRKTPAEGAEGRRGSPAQKRIRVNDVPRRGATLAGLVPMVLFLVEDLEIIRGEPARRRDFLDTDLSAISRTYAWALRQYTRVVEQRNRLLKDIREGTATPENLLPWNAQLADFGGRLLEVRGRFVANLSGESGGTYRGLSASPQQMSIAYLRDWGDPAETPTSREDYTFLLAQALAEMEGDEIRRGSTLAGPHRDDLRFLVDSKDVRLFGSQGEQRTAALALRVAEFTLLNRLIGEPPVLLLDDILSELDRQRRAAMLEHLAPMAQVILTTTDVDAIGLPPDADLHLYRVTHGTVSREDGNGNAR